MPKTCLNEMGQSSLFIRFFVPPEVLNVFQKGTGSHSIGPTVPVETELTDPSVGHKLRARIVT
jgi:hypothetical protein